VVLLGAYLSNRDFLPGNDAKANMHLPLSLLHEGNLSFTPREAPFMFLWNAQEPPPGAVLSPPEQALLATWRPYMAVQDVTTRLESLDAPLGGVSAGRLWKAGLLRPEPMYYLVRSTRKTADGQDVYVDTFGPGAGLTALPVMAAVELVGDPSRDPALMWYAAKLVAAMLVAGSAVFVFLTARRFTTNLRSAALAGAYGLGTCVWSVSSQALWQHGPNEFFLAMGTYFLFRSRKEGPRRALWPVLCGLALAAAAACRPTSVLVAVAVGLYLLVADRRAMGWFVLGALPIAAALAGYNTYYLGAPWSFGQAQVGHQVAINKTGSPQLWTTPLLTGLAGLMVSPSRGLLVFSPVVLVSAVGIARMWRRAYAPLAPLLAGMLGLWVMAFKWFDWWGGWCYGYRPLVDTMPLLAMLAIPALDWLFRRRWALAAAGVLLAWSVLVQVVGAYAYDVVGWNGLTVRWEVYFRGQQAPAVVYSQERVEEVDRTYPNVQRILPIIVDIDRPEHRDRLWSVRDSQILYHLRHFTETRRLKHEEMADSTRPARS
jgi:hypothetical protein